jgi:hypothetical protein
MVVESKRLNDGKRAAYSDALTKYIRLNRYPYFCTLLTVDDDIPLEDSQNRIGKFPLLFDHFGIAEGDPDRWAKLAHALAITHVPGFRIVRDAGRPTQLTWDVRQRFYQAFVREKSKQTARLRATERSRGQSARRRSEAKDSAVCSALVASAEFKKALPELAGRNTKALQNLIADVRQERRKEWFRRLSRKKARPSLLAAAKSTLAGGGVT